MFLTRPRPNSRRNRIDQDARDLYAVFLARVSQAVPFDRLPTVESEAWKAIASCVRFRDRRAS